MKLHDIKGQGHSLTFAQDLTKSANKLMVQTPGFMILRRGLKPHNMSLASNKIVFYNDFQIHLKKKKTLSTQVSGLGLLVL